MGLLTVSTAAGAHHDAAIAPVSPAPMYGRVDAAGPSLAAGVAWDTSVFGRVLQGSKRFGGEGGQVVRHTWTHRAAWTLPSGTGLEVRAPVVVLDAVASGDLELEIRQTLDAFTFSGGVAAPTGAYTRDPVLQASTVTVEGGAVELVTTDVRASAGSGAWTGILGAQGVLGSDWQLVGSGVVRIPLTRTVDDIRWGSLFAGSGGVLARVGGAWRAGLNVDVRHQLAHRFWEMDDHLGVTVERRSGRQTVLGIRPVATHRVWSSGPERRPGRLDCEVGLHLPVWQRVQGVQLSESASGRVACTVVASTRRAR